MADDILTIINAAWGSVTPTKGINAYHRVRHIRTVNYGLVLEETAKKYTPMDIQAPYGTDNYYVYLIGRSQAEIETLTQELVRISDAFTGNTTYDRMKFFPSNLEKLSIVTESGHEIPTTDQWQVYQSEIFLTRKYHVGHRLFQPETNDKLAENR